MASRPQDQQQRRLANGNDAADGFDVDDVEGVEQIQLGNEAFRSGEYEKVNRIVPLLPPLLLLLIPPLVLSRYSSSILFDSAHTGNHSRSPFLDS